MSIRWEEIFEELSNLDGILNKDPSGFYSGMEFTSRNYYRTELVKIARRYRVSELEVARLAVDMAEDAMEPTGGN